MSTASDPIVPNHHAHQPGFSGLRGWLAALSMRVGRGKDAALAISLTEQNRGDRVLDIGCGPGVAARLSAARGGVVTGVDPADVMIDMARSADRANAVTWQLGAAESLPVADDSHDVVWSLASVHHWPEVEAGLAEVLRVLDDGGRFLALERHCRPQATGLASHGWTTEQAERFAEMCLEAGFESASVTTHAAGRRRVIAVVAAA